MIDTNSEFYIKGVSEGRDIRITIECLGSSLPDVLTHIEQAIRGCGFHPIGTLDFVDGEI